LGITLEAAGSGAVGFGFEVEVGVEEHAAVDHGVVVRELFGDWIGEELGFRFF
jgi:hypothetical protein